MLKMDQVIQIGEIEGNIHYYIEDYAYTFLKKQEEKKQKKYYLYGEKEETQDKIKLYIYGIGQKPKMEQTYFKDYYPLGFLKIKEEGNFWISLNGQENLINGVYVFYAPNQAMQEYLVDYHKEEIKEEKTSEELKKRLPTKTLPMKETMIPIRRLKKRSKTAKEDRILHSLGGVFIAFLFLFTLTTANGRNKIEIFKQVIKETMSDSVKMISEEDLVIEEKVVERVDKQEESSKNKSDYEIKEVEDRKQTENKQIMLENVSEIENTDQTKEAQDKIVVREEDNNEEIIENKNEDSELKKEETKIESEKNEEIKDKKSQYEEYIVKNGDTLVGICKKRYNSLSKMKEICEINNIENADYIAPGQKLYLP